MRAIESPSGLRYQLHETPADLATLTALAARNTRLWVDTEVADWDTPAPRLSLIQLRLEDGSLHVVDVLSPEMAAAYEATLAVGVMAAPHIEKWAHYARFERRILGADKVQGFRCTFELARGVPYHRLPLRSLKLATLVAELCGTTIDKTLQRGDWGRRPLAPDALDYAAWDPEWCYRVHQRLEPLVVAWDPASDDPDAIHRRYQELLVPARDAKHRKTAIWDAVKAFLIASEHDRFSDFLLQRQVHRTIPIDVLAWAVTAIDPHAIAEFGIPVPRAVLEALRDGGEAAVRAQGRESTSVRFRGPRAPRDREKPTYTLDVTDPARVAADYRSAWHAHRVLDSERQELKDRMRAWMDHHRHACWGEFELSEGTPRLTADVRVVARWLDPASIPSTGLPARFLTAFSPRELAALSEYVDATARPILRWRPDRNGRPLDLVQSRDWHEEDDVSSSA